VVARARHRGFRRVWRTSRYERRGTHPVVQAAVEESDEVLVRSVVTAEGDLAGETVGGLTRSVAGLRVLAVRRDGGDGDTGLDGRDDGVVWQLSPSDDVALRPGDHLIAKGTRASASLLSEMT
jgi:uncharacterized protein with PhoU and TrkA domain